MTSFIFSAVYPAQFAAVLHWLGGIPKDARPSTFVEFGTEPGVVLLSTTGNNWQFEVMDPRREPRGILYRYAASVHEEAEDFPRVCLITFDQNRLGHFISALTGWPVTTLPLPVAPCFLFAAAPANARSERRSWDINARTKDFSSSPTFYELLLDVPGLEFLVHNSMPEEMTDTQRALREIAQSNPRVIADERAVFGTDWGTACGQGRFGDLPL